MIRTLRFLGVAVLASVALSAVASSASADTFFSEENKTVTLTGTQEETDIFAVHAGEVKCKHVGYVGTVSNSPTTTVKVKPTYKECTFVGLAATVNVGTCEYLFHINDVVANDTTGTVDIVCPSGDITVTAPSAGTAKCIVHVPAQTGLGTATFKNVGAAMGSTREVTVEVHLTGIKYSQTAGTAETGNCTTADNTVNGTYKGKALVTGEEDKATSPAHIGIFIA